MRDHNKLVELYPHSARVRDARFYATMGRGFFIAALLLAFVLTIRAASAQTATRVFDPDSVHDRAVLLVELPDGGVAVRQLCGAVDSQDGLTTVGDCLPVSIELQKAGQRATANNVLTLAGQEWLRRMKLQNDGGSL
jgi:hypothetical protein